MTDEEFKELWEGDYLEEVYKKIDDSWRHGNNMTTVYHYEKDDTYWQCQYRVSGDGEYHGIRDDEFTLRQVTPVKKIVEITEYVAVEA